MSIVNWGVIGFVFSLFSFSCSQVNEEILDLSRVLENEKLVSYFGGDDYLTTDFDGWVNYFYPLKSKGVDYRKKLIYEFVLAFEEKQMSRRNLMKVQDNFVEGLDGEYGYLLKFYNEMKVERLRERRRIAPSRMTPKEPRKAGW